MDDEQKNNKRLPEKKNGSCRFLLASVRQRRRGNSRCSNHLTLSKETRCAAAARVCVCVGTDGREMREREGKRALREPAGKHTPRIFSFKKKWEIKVLKKKSIRQYMFSIFYYLSSSIWPCGSVFYESGRQFPLLRFI